jgi:hypothetical protein
MISNEARKYLEILVEAPQGPAGQSAREGAIRALEGILDAAGFERDSLLRSMERASTELEGRVQELSLLRRLSEVLAETFDSERLGLEILHVLQEEQEVADSALWVADSEELHWRCGVGRGVAHGTRAGSVCQTARMGEGLVGLTATRREALVVHDALVESRCRNAEEFLRMGSFCLFPLLCSGRLVGVLWLGSTDRFAFPSQRLRILTLAAGQIAQGLAGSDLFARLSRYSESLSEVVEARCEELEEKHEEIRRTRAAWQALLGRLQIGGVQSELEPMPKPERLHRVVQNLRACAAARGGAHEATIASALALIESFMADYDVYLDLASRTGWPVLMAEERKEAA